MEVRIWTWQNGGVCGRRSSLERQRQSTTFGAQAGARQQAGNAKGDHFHPGQMPGGGMRQSGLDVTLEFAVRTTVARNIKRRTGLATS